jgi:hypothetical protein
MRKHWSIQRRFIIGATLIRISVCYPTDFFEFGIYVSKAWRIVGIRFWRWDADLLICPAPAPSSPIRTLPVRSVRVVERPPLIIDLEE